MENKTINLAVVAEVARALQNLKEQIVFVGGAVVSLYTDDPAADEIRPTGDIDITINVVNLSDWSHLQDQLATLGFYPDPFGHSICSYKYNNIPVDIMSVEDSPFGPTNKWYKIGFNKLWTVLVEDQVIKILAAPCYLATKFEAFLDRGNDYRTSHDIEDIIYIIDNSTNIVCEVIESESKIRLFIAQQFQHLLDIGMLDEVLMAHIHPLMLEERMPLAKEKIELIVKI
jgi:predicted nucleotidyltransferase